MATIHPTAIVEEGAYLADDVIIGAYTFVSAKSIKVYFCVNNLEIIDFTM